MIREMFIRIVLSLHLGGYLLQRWAGGKHKSLIAGRSAEQVKRMERKAGLL